MPVLDVLFSIDIFFLLQYLIDSNKLFICFMNKKHCLN